MPPTSPPAPEDSNQTTQPTPAHGGNCDIEVISREGDEQVGQHLRFHVGSSIKHRRLDKYLGGRFNRFSRTRLQKLIKEQGVNVNARAAKPSHKLNPGDEIDLILPPREVRELIPEDIPINVIYEDDHMIVVNKQADLVVHPARGNTHGTLELRADRINQPVGMHPKMRVKIAIRPDGKEAITFYEVLEEFRGFSLVKLSPKTGRTHQLRVHMAYLHHPIVADDMYGGKVVYDWQIEDRDPEPAEPLMGRVALHAWKLEIRHPISSKMMEFEAPLPLDLQTLIDKLRKFRPEKNHR